MADPTASVAALLRERVRLLALCKREGVKRISIQSSVNDRDAYLKLDLPWAGDREARLARVQKAVLRVLPKAKRTGDGVEFALMDLRGDRAGIHAARIVRTFHRFFNIASAASPAEERRLLKALAYRSVEASGGAVVVDGFRSRTARSIVTTAVEALFRSGKDDDVEKLLELLAAPVGKGPPKDAAKLRKELDGLVAKLVKPRVLIRYAPGKVSATGTHLRGPAYVEVGETWPSDSKGPMDLFMQIAAGGPIPLPKGIALLQVFLGSSEIPYDRTSPALLLKTYAKVSPKRQAAPPKPARPARKSLKAYAIEGVKDGSVPEFDALPKGPPARRIISLCKALDSLVPADAYAAACARFVKEPQAWSFAGGWPRWLQGADPRAAKASLVLQLGSQPKPDINWADSGVVHLFDARDGLQWYLQSS